MRATTLLCLSVLAGCAAHEEDSIKEPWRPAREAGSVPTIFAFDTDKAGGLPEGWRVDATRSGVGGSGAALAQWDVAADPSAPSSPQVLALTSSTHGEQDTFNLCWTDRVAFRDGRLWLALEPVAGDVDQGGGPIWRVQDRDNYYLCRVNPLEQNFRVYRVIDGMRHQLGSALVDIDPGTWHSIEVLVKDDQIICTLDGGARLAVQDANLPREGGVGVWTKADAVTSFDDLRVEAAP